MYTIPKTFLHVIKTMIPEILEIKIINCETIKKISPTTLTEIENYLVIVDLLIDGDKSSGGYVSRPFEKYSEKLNTQFNYVYGDLDFIRFSVGKFEIKNKPTNREIFMSLFVNND